MERNYWLRIIGFLILLSFTLKYGILLFFLTWTFNKEQFIFATLMSSSVFAVRIVTQFFFSFLLNFLWSQPSRLRKIRCRKFFISCHIRPLLLRNQILLLYPMCQDKRFIYIAREKQPYLMLNLILQTT
jgi:magnesium-transporting ATPase (P-type)